MSDNRKKSKRRRSDDETPTLSVIEKSIAKYLRFQCPTKKGMLMGTQVPYFNGTKAVECLAESKWSSIRSKTPASESAKDPVCFSSKHDAVQMLRKFLDNDMFRRVVKVYKEDKPSADQTAGDTSQSNTPRTARQRKTKSTAPTEPTTTDETKEKDKDKSKKKKFKFEYHDEQTIIDSPNEFYVWIYSPTTVKQYIMGGLLVIGCIGVCLFPLWPAEVRTGVYYLSMVLASLLGLLLSLAVFKYIIFAGVWLITMGRIKFWLLPNLTEDVGFFDSFVPLYTLNVNAKKKTDKNDVKKENVDNEDDEDEQQQSTKKKDDLNEEEQTNNQTNVVGQSESEQEDEGKEKSTSRSSSIDDVEDGTKRQKSSDEDFEVLSKEELDTK